MVHLHNQPHHIWIDRNLLDVICRVKVLQEGALGGHTSLGKAMCILLNFHRFQSLSKRLNKVRHITRFSHGLEHTKIFLLIMYL